MQEKCKNKKKKNKVSKYFKQYALCILFVFFVWFWIVINMFIINNTLRGVVKKKIKKKQQTFLACSNLTSSFYFIKKRTIWAFYISRPFVVTYEVWITYSWRKFVWVNSVHFVFAFWIKYFIGNTVGKLAL